MKVSTLACDYCTAVVAATSTVTLMRGPTPSKGDPSLDLCKQHLGAIEHIFKPRVRRGASGKAFSHRNAPEAAMQRVEEKRTKDRLRYEPVRKGPPKGTGGRPRGEQAPWAAREATVLSLLPAVGKVYTSELWRQVSKLPDGTTMPPGAYKKVMQRLKEKGFVQQIGSRSRTKYQRVNGEA